MQDRREGLQLAEQAEGIEKQDQPDNLDDERAFSTEISSPQPLEGDRPEDSATGGEPATESLPGREGSEPHETPQPELEQPDRSESQASEAGPAVKAEVEAADKEAVTGASMGKLMRDMGHDYRTFRRGDIVEGVVVSIDKDGMMVDIGTKSEAIVPGHEAARYVSEGKEQVHVGDEVVACVVQPENADGHVVLSLSRARAERGWRQVQKLFEAGQSAEAEVIDRNKGGLIVNIDGVRGFVPISQIVGLRQNAGNEAEIESRLAEMVGKRIPVKVLEINRRRNRLILSERAAVSERRALRKEQLLSELQEGEIRQGKVSSVCDFGAFVDLGGADGLVHLSELSWGQVSHPSEAVQVGDEVAVYVLSVDREKKKIALSIRRSQPEPWSLVGEKYKPGDLVKATVTKLSTFGAFARVEPGVEGLIHVSELADGHVAHPSNVVKEGDVLTLRIIRVDPARRRLGLSLRQAPKPEELAAEAEEVVQAEAAETQVEQTELAEPEPVEVRASEDEAPEPTPAGQAPSDGEADTEEVS